MKISSEKRCDSYNFLDKSTAVQIPVDACPTFVLKRRSFSFVIDKKRRAPRVSFFFALSAVNLSRKRCRFTYRRQAASRAKRVILSGRPKNNRYPLWVAVVFSVRQDLKDERYRATFRWTVATVSDQGEVTPSRDQILSGGLTLG